MRKGGGLYILRDKKCLRVHDVIRWGMWFETADRQVALTEFLNTAPWIAIDRARHKAYAKARAELGLSMQTVEHFRFLHRMVTISTIFIGLDHSYGSGPPLLFETMVFNGPLEGEQRRYPDWTSAEVGHQEIVERVRRAMDPRAATGDRGVPVENGG